MCARNISLEVKAADAYGRQPYQLHVPIFLKYGNLSLLEPSQTRHVYFFAFACNLLAGISVLYYFDLFIINNIASH
jgi:hypothetical protein